MANKQPYLRTKIYSIYKPDLGLVLNEPTSNLNPRACIACQNVRFENGRAFHRTGYSDYGTGTITGIPLSFYNYNGTAIMATTTNVYYLDGAAWTSFASSIGCDIDNRISLNTVYSGTDDTFYLTIGSKDYLAKKWDGTTLTALASDVSTWKPRIIVPYQYRLLMFNIDVNGTDKPLRMSYCAANDISDWDGTGAASRNLIQGAGDEILNAVPIKNYLGIYKDKSITLLSYVGGDSIFATQVMVDGIGLIGQDAIVNLGTKHIFMGNDYNIYQWEGGGELIPIGNPIRSDIISNLGNTSNRTFAVKNNEEREVSFFMPTSAADYPTIYYSYNIENKSWSKHLVANSTGGGNIVTSADNELSMIGTYVSSTGVAEYMYASYNEDGVAISAYFTTPDIVISEEEHMVINKDFTRVIVEAAGGTTLTCQYSTDSGQNWSAADTATITSYYDVYSFHIAKTARKIRFKFSSTATDAAWGIRYIGIEYKYRERK